MSLFGGNHLLLIRKIPSPLLLKNPNFTFMIRCCCSHPIRYVPKTASHNQTQTPPKSNTPNKPQQTPSHSEHVTPLTIKTTDQQQHAQQFAMRALAARAFTSFELQNKLRDRNFPPHVITKVLTDLQAEGYINDYLYAEAFSQSRWSSSAWGPAKIRQALARKGVSQAHIQKATNHVFSTAGAQHDNESTLLGFSKSAMDQLFIQASKQWARSQNVDREKRKARIVRWLQYRGFTWAVVSLILKKLEPTHPS